MSVLEPTQIGKPKKPQAQLICIIKLKPHQILEICVLFHSFHLQY